VALVIATDGVPSDGDKHDVVQALKRLGNDLSVFMVIRLSTDEDDVMKYYQEIDEQLELPLEVVDDMQSEAREILAQGNNWLVYSPLLHKIREGGMFVKLFDLLDERRLTPTEVFIFAQLLVQKEGRPPIPQDARGFCMALENAVAEAPLVYDATHNCMAPPIRFAQARESVMPQIHAYPHVGRAADRPLYVHVASATRQMVGAVSAAACKRRRIHQS